MQAAPVLNPARIERARLGANMSYADLAYAIRQATGGRLKPTEQSIRRWVQGVHKPSDGVIPAIAVATSNEIAFFYEQDADDDGEARLLRDIEHLPADLRLRITRAIRTRAEASSTSSRRSNGGERRRL